MSILPPVRLQFGGCAGLNHYMFGVGAYIQEHYVLGPDVEIRTVSGSNYVGMCMLSKYSVESIWRLWSARLDDLFRSRPWTGLWALWALVEDHSREVLQKDGQRQTLERYRQHSIRIALLGVMVTKWFRDHRSHEDYLSAIFAGSFLPGLCGGMWRLYRGYRCLDGGLRLPRTSRGSRSTPDHPERTLSISVWDCRTLSRRRLAWMAGSGLWCGSAQHAFQFSHGYAHARDVLAPRLETLLPHQSHRLPEISGEVRWDAKRHLFRTSGLPVRSRVGTNAE